MINCNNTRSSRDYRNYVGGDATINARARSHVYPTISTRFRNLTKLSKWRKKWTFVDDGFEDSGIEKK